MRNWLVFRRWLVILGALINTLNLGCTGLSIGSDVLIYKGRIISGSLPVDTSIQIFASNRGRSIFVDGKISHHLNTIHPDSGGFYFDRGTSPNYGENEDPPPHWEGGPLEIFVTHPSFQDYHDTLSKEELKALPQITPEQAGIKLDKIERGVWVLPDIILQPK